MPSDESLESQAVKNLKTGRSSYKDRAATAECVNAIARNRGLIQLTVRGLKKVKVSLLWFALAHNVMRATSLCPAGA